MNKTISLIVLLSGTFLSKAQYTYLELGPGTAYDINSSGKVALSIDNHGVIFDGQSLNDVILQDYLWNPFTNEYDPWPTTHVSSINDTGLICADPERGTFPIVYDTVNDQTIDGLLQSNGTSLNNSGHIVLSDLQWYVPIAYSSVHGSLSPYQSTARQVNETGTIVGASSTIGDKTSWNQMRACVFDGEGIHFIDSRLVPDSTNGEDDWSEAMCVNDSDHIAGWMRETNALPRHAFLHTGASMMDLGTLGGAESVALDINNSGTIIGWANNASEQKRAFIYTNGTMQDLNDLVPVPDGWVLEEAVAINNSGQIAAHAMSPLDVQHAVMINPGNFGVAPRITEQPASEKTVYGIGETFTLSVQVFGHEPIAFQWQLDDQDLPGANTSTLEIASVQTNHTGAYRVLVSNDYGLVISSSVSIEVPDALLDIATYAGIGITADLGTVFQMEFKNSVNDPEWTILPGTVTITNNPHVYIDISAPASQNRVYRAVKIE